MRTVLRSHFKLLVIVSGLLLAVAGVALADVIVPDGDVVAAGNQAGTNASPLDLGSVKGGVQVKPQVSFELQCQTGSNHIDDTQGVDIAYSSADSTIPSGATVSATSGHIGSTQTTGQNADFGVPSSWPDDGTQCPNPDPNPIVK